MGLIEFIEDYKARIEDRRFSGTEFFRIAPDVKLGKSVKIFAFVNLYGCEIGDNTRLEPASLPGA